MRLKTFVCDACQHVSEPVHVASVYPDGWFRVQQKVNGYWSQYGDDHAYLCPPCGDIVMKMVRAKIKEIKESVTHTAS